MKTTILVCFALTALSACHSPDDAALAPQAVKSSAPVVKALPFTIEGAMLSDLFQNNLKVATVQVGVDGGTAPEWSATAIAIAEKVSTYGADSVEVSVRLNKITEPAGVRFREVVHAYFSPNPDHSVWDDGQKWKVLQADSGHLATQQDVEITQDFNSLNDKLIEKGVDPDKADKKAGAVIAKKYGLPRDWALPLGNDLNAVPRDSLSVDAFGATDGMVILEKCLNGKIVRVMTKCGS